MCLIITVTFIYVPMLPIYIIYYIVLPFVWEALCYKSKGNRKGEREHPWGPFAVSGVGAPSREETELSVSRWVRQEAT